MKKPETSLRTLVRMTREDRADVAGLRLASMVERLFHVETTVRHGKVYSVGLDLDRERILRFGREGLRDSIVQEVFADGLPKSVKPGSYIFVGRLPGVTDDEGASAQRVLEDMFGLPRQGAQKVFSADLYLFGKTLEGPLLGRIASEILGNPLVDHMEWGPGKPRLTYDPRVAMEFKPRFESVALPVDEDGLLKVSRERLLSLNLAEMEAIRKYFGSSETRSLRSGYGLGEDPTECELEILGQTWSEHCKHKEFAAIINYRDTETGEEKTIDSLFKTFIQAPTIAIRDELRANGNDWLVKVFSDNAGVVRIDEERLFVFKVETHNSPSALDPYGGALTGIVGNNRDPLGTGRGGGRLLFNTDVLCFASPFFAGKLLPGQLHPRRIMQGVIRGIEDGGNKSGVPTVNGAIVFDDRFRAKPLVYCGTGAILPARLAGKASWEKEIKVGDRIVMGGGRVGKDGIHGATFSSLEIDETSPQSAVQIGSPITQKMFSDFLEVACASGLVRCCTDNGAGGLSSSVGELASIIGGAEVDLEKVPLKYPGLQPWEIFLSESQERMTLVVDPARLDGLMALAGEFDVELTDIGAFTDDGMLRVGYGGKTIAAMELEFLHDGVPRKNLDAEWTPPPFRKASVPANLDIGKALLDLMGSLNICSREAVIRRYDHEVKGKTIVKPLMGRNGVAPQDAAVVRVSHDSWTGIAVSNGICPRYGDFDAFEMSAGAFDEGVRQIVAVGGKLPDPTDSGNLFWSVNDNFCVPDSVFDAVSNPDGKYKLAQLVRMCEALKEMSLFFRIPMTSGKDSMKNDFRWGGEKISVPPTVLYSMTAKIPDVRRVVTTDFKAPGDLVFLIGPTFDELGGSEFLRLIGKEGGHVPRVRKKEARERYLRMADAHKEGLFASCHDLSDGGLGVAVAESCFGGGMGCRLEIPECGLPPATFLFSETHSRFLASVPPERAGRVEEIFGTDALRIGKVTGEQVLDLAIPGKEPVRIPLARLLSAWKRGLEGIL